ncbi:MAG: hypothetical protein ACXABU_12475 [Candidatus Hodarchaeales archaeon]|jgi:hypothetical protein
MISEVVTVIILTLFTLAIGISIVQKKLKENLLIIVFFAGFILFVDELWMLGIPFGYILPDMSVLHIEGVYHWMIGLAFMIVLMVYYFCSKFMQRIEK